MSWKNLFKRIEMPDKNDPKYRDTYEQEVAAGEKFAEVVGIKWLAGHLQSWGSANKKLFLALAFGFVILLFILNLVRIVRVANSPSRKAVAVERVDGAINKKSQEVETLNSDDYGQSEQN